MAVPTTLSGAEMTRIHRHATGVDESTPRVRCAVVVIDPALAASQPVDELGASTLNALGHAIEAPCMVNANPVATLAAHEAVRLLRDGWTRGEPDRDTLALGSLLAGYALDNTGLALHHVLAQTLVRMAGVGHGAANAAMLPHSIGALAWRRPEAIDALTAAVGEDLADIVRRIGTPTLTDLGVDPSVLPGCADAAAARPQLQGHATPGRPGRDSRSLRERPLNSGLGKAHPVDIRGQDDARSWGTGRARFCVAASGRCGGALAHSHARRRPRCRRGREPRAPQARGAPDRTHRRGA